jgi:hypothetical protein
MKWIKAGERLPNPSKNENYPVRHKDGKEATQYWNGTGFINFGTANWNYHSDIDEWLESPDIPTEEELKDEAEALYTSDLSPTWATALECAIIQSAAYIEGRRKSFSRIKDLEFENKELKGNLETSRLSVKMLEDQLRKTEEISRIATEGLREASKEIDQLKAMLKKEYRRDY